MRRRGAKKKHVRSGGDDSEPSAAREKSATEEGEIVQENSDSPDKGAETTVRSLSNDGAVLQSDAGDHGNHDIKDAGEPHAGVTRLSVKEVYKKPEEVSRNRRLLGSLMGHLGSAKQKVEQDSQLLQLQSTKAQSALSKRERDAEEAKHREREKRRSIAEDRLKLNIQNVVDSSTKWKESLEKSRELLMTSFEPRLTWMPAKHCAVTKDLLTKRNVE
eukprot:gene44537-54470_t